MVFEAQGLRKALQGRTLYEGLGFRLEPGQTLAVRGPSGAGKSQLLRQLAGLDPEDDPALDESGRVAYRGRDMSEWSAYEWRTEVCYVPQHAPRLGGTPADFAARIAHLREQHAREADDPRSLAAEFGLLAPQWEQSWSELSVGERQRSMLAVLLSRRPGVLLLDEPTAALDQDSVRAVEAVLADRTCVWVTHSPAQARRVADDVLLLSKESDAD